jgi:hypothetical protein
MTSTTPGRRIIHHATRLLVHPYDMARQAAQFPSAARACNNLQQNLYASLLPLYSTYPILLYQYSRLAFFFLRLVLRSARLIGIHGADTGGRIDLVFFFGFTLTTTWPLPYTGHCRRVTPVVYFALPTLVVIGQLPLSAL